MVTRRNTHLDRKKQIDRGKRDRDARRLEEGKIRRRISTLAHLPALWTQTPSK